MQGGSSTSSQASRNNNNSLGDSEESLPDDDSFYSSEEPFYDDEEPFYGGEEPFYGDEETFYGGEEAFYGSAFRDFSEVRGGPIEVHNLSEEELINALLELGVYLTFDESRQELEQLLLQAAPGRYVTSSLAGFRQQTLEELQMQAKRELWEKNISRLPAGLPVIIVEAIVKSVLMLEDPGDTIQSLSMVDRTFRDVVQQDVVQEVVELRKQQQRTRRAMRTLMDLYQNDINLAGIFDTFREESTPVAQILRSARGPTRPNGWDPTADTIYNFTMGKEYGRREIEKIDGLIGDLLRDFVDTSR
jgi:hypothetical protein